MPYNDPDPTDPMTLHGMAIETDAATAEESMREMAVCFAEEFARMGFDPQRIRRLFENSQYHGPYTARQALGADATDRIVEQAARLYPPGRTRLPIAEA